MFPTDTEIWKRKKCLSYRFEKSGKNQNAWKTGKYQALRNIGSRHHQRRRNERSLKRKKFLHGILETKICCRNLCKGINNWVVIPFRFSRPFLKFTWEDLRQMNQKIRKGMTIHLAIFSRHGQISRLGL